VKSNKSGTIRRLAVLGVGDLDDESARLHRRIKDVLRQGFQFVQGGEFKILEQQFRRAGNGDDGGERVVLPHVERLGVVGDGRQPARGVVRGDADNLQELLLLLIPLVVHLRREGVAPAGDVTKNRVDGGKQVVAHVGYSCGCSYHDSAELLNR